MTNIYSKKNNLNLNCLIPLVETLAKMFGKNCEVVLHDLSIPNNSIIAIENGHVTGRKKGDSVTDFALTSWRQGGFGNKNKDRIINYKAKTNDGKILKSSAVFIKNIQKEIIGCICINYDLTEYIMFDKIMKDFFTYIDLDKAEVEEETFTNDVNEVLENIINEAIEKIGKPVSMMKKIDKLMVTKIVDDKGGFLVREAINQLANKINVSRYTVYNYIEELKSENKQNNKKKIF